MLSVDLRTATNEDQDFLFESYKVTLKPYVEWAWGWEEAFQRDSFQKHFPIAQFKVISINGSDAGGLYVEEQDSLRFIRLIYLLPAFQAKGVGRNLIEQEITKTKEAKKVLHLKVVKINPAKSLYDRLGFKVLEENDVTYHLHLPV
jgi:GNAT superfamily N-acetyltransferase